MGHSQQLSRYDHENIAILPVKELLFKESVVYFGYENFFLTDWMQ